MKPRPLTRAFPLIGLLLVALAGVACSGDDGGLGATPSPEPTGSTETDVDEDAADGGVLVVATTSILGDVVANVVGEAAEVVVLMPAGVDPHGYQPSGTDAAALRDADLIVSVGLGLEENLVDAIEAAEAEGVRVLAMAEHLDPLELAAVDDEDDHDDDHGDDDHGDDDHGDDDHGDDEVHSADDGHDHGPLDPHVWLDPVRMAEGAEVIATELDAVASGDWQARAHEYAEEVLAVHAELEAGFAALPDGARQLVTNHDALGYLAARYDFEVVGTVIPGTSTQAEPDARAFAELVETIDETDVPAIFTENIDNAALAEQLADEVGARGGGDVAVVGLYTDALGEPGSGAETYLGLLRENGRRIAEALG